MLGGCLTGSATRLALGFPREQPSKTPSSGCSRSPRCSTSPSPPRSTRWPCLRSGTVPALFFRRSSSCRPVRCLSLRARWCGPCSRSTSSSASCARTPNCTQSSGRPRAIGTPSPWSRRSAVHRSFGRDSARHPSTMTSSRRGVRRSARHARAPARRACPSEALSCRRWAGSCR
jgi:hypothetical protein